MKKSAREIIGLVMSMNLEQERDASNFFNYVLAGTVPQAKLDSFQENLLMVILQNIRCDMKSIDESVKDTTKDRMRIHQLALQIATWINSVHAANTTAHTQ